jgi:hypothetical protein
MFFIRSADLESASPAEAIYTSECVTGLGAPVGRGLTGIQIAPRGAHERDMSASLARGLGGRVTRRALSAGAA